MAEEGGWRTAGHIACCNGQVNASSGPLHMGSAPGPPHHRGAFPL